LYMPKDGHWLASFEVIPPPPKKKLVFPRPKNENSPLKTGCARPLLSAHFWKKNIRPIFFCFFFGCFCRKISHADVDSREPQAILLKKVKNQAKIAFFLFFGRKVWRTILSRRSSRLSRTSRAPSRLSRPRPIDCDREPEQTVKNYPVFGQLFF